VAAIHDSELTRALEFMPATGSTPTGPGTTGNQWWPTAWHYFVMPDSVKEALRSDGTASTVLSDAAISAGALLNTNGTPAYPILISLAAEAIRDDEIAQLTNYVAAGGTLLVGGAAFTRTTNGSARGDFAIAQAMGIHSATADLANWAANATFSKTMAHPLTAHIPGGVLDWNMPVSADEIAWGVSPLYLLSRGHLCWQVQAADALVLAQGDSSPYLLTKSYGHGIFIYLAALQPFLGHGGNAPGMYAYGILRNAIQGAFASANLPIPKLSPWPYPFDAALSVRHDLENLQDQINSIEASAQFEYTNGAKGDYYFCTGTLRVEMSNSPATIASLRRAVSNYGAIIGPHNGGYPNVNNFSLVLSNYDYWHWGTDEALDVPASNLPPGFANGAAYGLASTSNSFLDVEGWLAGLTNGLRLSVAPHFNATREASCQIELQLGINASGEQKLGPFPSWVLSSSNADMCYPFVSSPASEWYLIPPAVAQSMENGFGVASMRKLVDFYYSWGALINLYSHSSSAGGGLAGTLASSYVSYAMGKPRIWPVNSATIYSWWLARSNAQILSATYNTNGNQSVLNLALSGANDPQTAIEISVPGPSVSSLQVWTNGRPAGVGGYRTNGPIIKVLVGATVTNIQLTYLLNPPAQDAFYTVPAGSSLSAPAPGLLTNAQAGAYASLVIGPSSGSLTLSNNGGFLYTPASNFTGMDSFAYQAIDAAGTSAVATVTIDTTLAGSLFFDNFLRPTNADPLAPWIAQSGYWTITAGQLQGTGLDVGMDNDAYVAGNWTNYSVQAQMQLPAGAFVGGLEGRVNPVSGANYTVNVYPNGFPGETSSPVLKLWKFHSWQVLNSNPMQEAMLPPVGTNWHSVKMTFRGSEILVYFDGVQMLDVIDHGFDGLPAYLSGGIGVHSYTASTPFTATFETVLVSTTPQAANDSYTAVQNRTLTVPPPGVLSNDAPGVGTNLVALLVSGPTNGALTLNSDGSFVYVPATNYVGPDSFIYLANDGVTNSAPALVSLAILPNAPPMASNDAYGYVPNTTLSVPTPGVLANDTDRDGDAMTALLVGGPSHGTLALSTNGGFSYTPAANFTGTDSFTYQAQATGGISAVATVTLSNVMAGALFYDNFSRLTDPGPLTPWVAQSGAWTVTGGTMQGGNDALGSYGFVYLTNDWTDYTVQGQFRFSPGAYGGGLGGRLNPATGAHYAAWIYPNGNQLHLIKFQNWATPTFLSTVDLAAAGTNWHTLELAFQTNWIGVSYDGNLVSSVVDGSAPFLSGGLSLDMYTYAAAYQMFVSGVLVNPLAAPLIQSITRTNSSVAVTWSALSGYTYQLQYKDDLKATNWTDLFPAVTATGSSATGLDATGESAKRFYRVLVVP